MHDNFVLMATAKFTKFPCHFGDTKQFCSGGAAQLGSQKDVLKTIFSKNYMIAYYSSSRFLFRAKGSVFLTSLVILICSYEEVLPVIKKKLILSKDLDSWESNYLKMFLRQNHFYLFYKSPFFVRLSSVFYIYSNLLI